MNRRGVPKRHADIFGEHSSDWKDQERRVASRLNAETVPGSGSGSRHKGDVNRHKQGDYLIECKSTIHESLSVKGKWLTKISNEARAIGQRPALQIEIMGHSDPMTEPLWVMIPMSDYQRLIDKAGNDD